ncbi:hypothetical protein Q9Q94_02595 [Uliginosibacterium sp. 31-16]|uniref:DUF6587 family protein n=1 Tax=Uliginosibacterium sp. 31-16 TaxID=3068315 RepID=UPI00273D3640|nr:DUF6587 family protein [Uliginosibacterium sp. 31-16]MDP5238397.1 hypothetical protein [Uliginosibacterium sp. 31-16]
MSTYAFIEPVLVGLIIAASIGFALRRAAPRLFARLGNRLQATLLPAWFKTLGGKLLGDPASCSSGCGSCNSCGPSSAKDSQVVVLHRNKPVRPV